MLGKNKINTLVSRIVKTTEISYRMRINKIWFKDLTLLKILLIINLDLKHGVGLSCWR